MLYQRQKKPSLDQAYGLGPHRLSMTGVSCMASSYLSHLQKQAIHWLASFILNFEDTHADSSGRAIVQQQMFLLLQVTRGVQHERWGQGTV